MPGPRLPDDLQLHYVDNIDDAMAMKRWLSEDRGRDCIAIDVETTGLTWNRPGDDLRLVQIGDKHTGWAVPWHLWGGAFMECLNAWPGVIALHNMSYDLKFLEDFANWQIPWERMADTMIMAKIMRPGRPAGLKPLATQLVDPRADAGQKMLKKAFDDNGWGWATVPVDLPVYHMYGALDTVETAYLYDIFRADLKYPKVYDLEMSYLRCAYHMEKRGFRVDLDYAERKGQELHDFVDQSRQWAKSTYGVSIGSGPQLISYFGKLDGELMARHAQHETNFGIMGTTPECDALCGGVKITETTKSGAPSMNADQLRKFLNHPDKNVAQLAKVTYDARRSEKLANTYFKAITERNVDSRIHCSINTMGAITGRNSVSEPNLQNLPSNSSVVKNAFVPDENELLLSSDLDQVEFRITACLSKDAGLLSLFKKMDAEGGDAFTTIMRDVYRDTSLQKSDPRRALIKGTVYGKAFGAGPEKMAETAGVPVEQMEDVVKKFDKQYPGMNQYQQHVINLVKKRYREEGEGYIITPTTERRIPVESDKAYKGTNYMIQGAAADVMKNNIIKLDAAGLGPNLRIPVHDEAMLSIPRSDIKEAQQLIKECMTTTEGWELPLTADCSDGLERWGAKYEDGH